MDATVLAWGFGLVLAIVPLLAQAVWYWNDVRFVAPLMLRRAGGDCSHDRAKLPPGHMGLPLLGETLSFLWYFNVLRRPDDFIFSKRQRYGEGVGMYRSHLFGKPTIITCAPESNKFVLQSDEHFSVRWPEPELIGFSSLVNVEGKRHTRLRRFVVDTINRPQALRRIAQTVQPRVVAALRSWAENGSVVACIETKKVTFANICKMFISMDPGPRTDMMDNCFEGLVEGLRAYPINLPGSAFHRALKCRRKLTAVFRQELEKRKQILKNGDDESKDLMDGLMRIKDEEGKQLSDEEVVDNIVSLVLAGYESTSLASMWGLYHISKSPEVLQKLREENMEINRRKTGDFITMDDIAQMKYTAKVVEEVIRVANVALTVHRIANKDIEYEGYRIPKGWQVLVWVRCLHTDPKHFDDPLTFNPERWNEPAKPGTFQVFGGGPRICAGNMLARIQLTIILHHLSLGYQWELINPHAKITYLPHPRPVDGAAMRFHAL